MKVSELIKELSEFDPDLNVVVRSVRGVADYRACMLVEVKIALNVTDDGMASSHRMVHYKDQYPDNDVVEALLLI